MMDTNEFVPSLSFQLARTIRLMRKATLILYYDTQWHAPLPRVSLPEGFEITADRSRYAEAQVVIFHIPEWKWKPRFLFPRKLPGQLWVAWSMECQANYPRLQDPGFMRMFDATMTYRLDSDLPVIYFMSYGVIEDTLARLAAPPQAKTAQAPAVSFISSRINHSGRRKYMRELLRHLRTDSYGRFMNNVRGIKDTGRPFKLATIARYKFTLAFENAIGRDYVTEKFFDPLIMGSLPVYLGAPNVAEFAPGEHCFINVQDYARPQALAEYLNYLNNDDAAYDAYFEWKKKPLRPAFLELVTPHRQQGARRLCEWLQDKMLEGET